MKKVWIIALVALTLGAAGCPEDKECPDARVIEEQLKTADELALRKAIMGLDERKGAGCLRKAVGPLTEIMTDSGKRHDIFTRSLVPPRLARAARLQPNWKQATPAVTALINAMFNEPSDLLRAQAAYALGDCGHREARAALKEAAGSDRSELARRAAELALARLDGSAGGGNGAVVAATVWSEPLLPADQSCLTPAAKEDLARHLIVLNPGLQTLPVCGEGAEGTP